MSIRKKGVALLACAGIAAGLAGCAVPAGQHGSGASADATTSQRPLPPLGSPSPAPSPVPPPGGKFSGSCDYTLSSSLYGANHLIGEIDATNTGGLGLVVRARISWPQEGYPPITATKTVRIPVGGRKAIRFHVAANDTVIGQLQSWQESHNFRDGCTYHATIIRTF